MGEWEEEHSGEIPFSVVCTIVRRSTEKPRNVLLLVGSVHYTHCGGVIQRRSTRYSQPTDCE